MRRNSRCARAAVGYRHSRLRVALATCEDPPVPDKDAELLAEPLEELGVELERPVWSDPEVDWSRFDLVQLSSTWDYQYRREDFLDWLRRAEGVTRVENPPELVEWNSDKRYLAELAEAEVPTIPTIWAEVGEGGEAAEEARDRGWDQAVVKPVVDAGAQRLRRVGPATWPRPSRRSASRAWCSPTSNRSAAPGS